MSKIKKTTVRRLRTVASKVFGSNDQNYRDFLSGYGVESTLDLTEMQAISAISALDDILKARKKARQKPSDGTHLSGAQLEFIQSLFDDLEIPEGKRQWAFIKKQVGEAKNPSWLTPKEATKVINGLKRYKESVKNHENDRINPANDELMNPEPLEVV